MQDMMCHMHATYGEARAEWRGVPGSTVAIL
jgi:hypothetical protein